MTLPDFAIEGGVALALARAGAVAGLMGAFGFVLYPVLLAPRAIQPRTLRTLRSLGYAALILALALCLCWLLAETSDMAGSLGAGAVWAVLSGTLFGHVMLTQCAMLALALAAWRFVPVLAPIAAGCAVLLQAGHSHAEAMDGFSVLLAADALHVLFASIWLGSLVPLFIVVRREPPATAADAAKIYAALIVACVCMVLMSAAYQSVILLGGLTGVVGTAYGWMAMLKTALMAALVVVAARDHARIVPALRGRAAALASLRLARSVRIQIGVGAAVIVAAGILTEVPPGMHAQPIWPFPWRFSLDAVREDADFMAEAVRGLAMAAAALLLLAGATASLLRWRRSWRAWGLRVGAVLTACLLVTMAAPHLDLLFVPAYPSQYFRSPTGFTVASVSDGAALFPQNCASCHGADGRGDGPAAKALPVPPANLTAAHLWMHPDGELYWWLAHGIQAPEGGPAMPGFAATLSEDQRWDLIDYIRAYNAGTSVDGGGAWGRVIQAPGFEALCPGGQTTPLAQFAGKPVRLVLGKASPMAGILTVAADAGAQPAPGLCVARDEQIGTAYGVASGLGNGDGGAVFLIDQAGLLRRVWKPDHTPDAHALRAALTDIRVHRAEPALAAGAQMGLGSMSMSGMDGMDGMNMGGTGSGGVRSGDTSPGNMTPGSMNPGKMSPGSMNPGSMAGTTMNGMKM